MGILSFIFGKRNLMPAKDMHDYTLTENSTPWFAQEYWCKRCKTDRTHREYMAGLCNGCGGYRSISLYGCSIRSIWNGYKWVKHYKEEGLEWTEEKTKEIVSENIEREKARQSIRELYKCKAK